MTIRAALTATVICAAGLSSVARPALAGPDLLSLAREAVSEDATRARAAIAALRAAGPAGLQALYQAWPSPDNGVVLTVDETGRFIGASGPNMREAKAADLDRLLTERDLRARRNSALDEVGQQHDNQASGLYWYTDRAKALEAATAEGRPILELRLLGKLTELYSCANSRFFRAVLYSNPQISKYLRDNYVLYWQTVRPVPRVTIDFGDGRRIETTITGNSIHYVLDSRGRPLEALPGMVAPSHFLAWLTRSNQLARSLGALNTEKAKALVLRNYHQARLETVEALYKADLARLAGMTAPSSLPRPINARRADTATVATGAPFSVSSEWARIAQLHLRDSGVEGFYMDARGLGTPRAVEASGLAMSKVAGERPVLNSMLNFQRTMAEDTVFNEYALQPVIHRWFTEGEVTGEIELLNKKVYAELFLTPDSDPWLGLRPAGVFTGLPNDGVVGAGTSIRLVPAPAQPMPAAPAPTSTRPQLAQNVNIAN